MSMFTEKKESEKALNIKGAEVMKTIINWKELSIKHEIQNQIRDSEGDVIGNHLGYETVTLTPEEFTAWITDEMRAATLSSVDAHVNAPEVVEEDPIIE